MADEEPPSGRAAGGQRGDQDSRGRFTSGNRWRYAAGQSGNPAGVPADRILTKSLVRLLEEELEKEVVEKGVNLGQAARLVARSLIAAALKGNVHAMREILERTDGKVPLPIRVGVSQGEPESMTDLRVIVVDAKLIPKDGPGGNGSGGNGDQPALPEKAGD